MTVRELYDQCDLTLVAGEKGLDNIIEHGFVGDLLSVVMGRAQENTAWVTIQSHINIVAVATLINCACIIIAEDYEADADAISKANEENIPLLVSKQSSYEVVKQLIHLGIL